MLETMLADFRAPQGDLPLLVAAMRLVMALVLGGIIGLERELHAKPAGLRTHILIALGAGLLALVSLDVIGAVDPVNSQIRTDPLRLMQAATAGLAFLAAGAIIHSGGAVHGLTTGASLWITGMIGLAAGTGRLWLAITATVLSLIVLLVLRVIDRHVDRLRDRGGRR